MYGIASIKKEWLLSEIDKLVDGGMSKAEIARKLDMLPQQLNTTLHSNRGISDTFLDGFIKVFKLNQIDLYSQLLPDPDADSIYKRIMEIFNEEHITVPKFQKQHSRFSHLFEYALHWNDPMTAKGWADLVHEYYPKYSYEWILTGKGSKYDDCDGDSYPTEVVTMSQRQTNSIPLIPYDAIAGYGSFDFQELPIEDYYSVADLKGADFLIRVKGDSMSPKYSGGDIVACKKIEMITFWQWHKIYAICTRNQGILIKRVEEYPNNPAFITCRSENPAYRPFEIHEDEIISAALVLGAIVLE